jgi:hypothetical protein
MDTGAQINPVELRTNTLRFIERFMRSIEGQGFGGSSFYDTSARFAAEVASDLELAYGLLWLGSDAATENPARHKRPGWDEACWNTARRVLLHHLDRAGQARGIEAARQMMTGDDTP